MAWLLASGGGKPASAEEFVFGEARTEWRWLTEETRSAIALHSPKAASWKAMRVHSTGTLVGDLEALEDYQVRVRGLEEGLAWHFLIGNGQGLSLGEIFIGPRWKKQLASGSAGAAEAISICLVGDFNRTTVPRSQLEALDELLEFLRARLGVIPVDIHLEGGRRPSPGERFPAAALRAAYGTPSKGSP
ncbi:MAG: hypothetical protein AAF555_11470 [Verrucomicrobiota bacterium]